MVGSTAPHLPWPLDLHRLLNVGRFPGNPLLFWELRLAVLFAGNFRQLAPRLVWAEARVVAGMDDFFAGSFNSLGPGRIPPDLLLLSRRLLQGVLG